MSLTLSTKCWEGDYRHVLTPGGIEELFGPCGPADARQVVLNRIADRAAASAMAGALVEEGSITRYAWAEDMWPELAASLGVPVTWFGAAWPYSAPELCELSLAPTTHVLHLAGDVRLPASAGWTGAAVEALDRWPDVAVVAPRTPSGVELTERGSRVLARGWSASQLFSDQCFLVRRGDLLSSEVVRAAHPVAGRYPRPGGALTFEARVASWLRAAGKWVATDASHTYQHPVSGTEGDSYAASASVPLLLPPLTTPGPGYPPQASADATGVVLAKDQERTVANAVLSLGWCRDVVVLDDGSTDRTVERALQAGARVRSGGVRDLAGVAPPQGWLVVVSADELVPAPLARQLVVALSDPTSGGVRAACRVLERGRWVPTDARLVLQRLGGGGSISETSEQLVRFGSSGIGDLVARLNAETDDRAVGAVFVRRASGRVAMRACWESLNKRRGLRRSLVDGFAAWLWVEKAWEAAQGGPTAVQASYDEIARDLLEAPRSAM